ncbi:zinc-binding dehydrogenase [Sphaerisporangium sp. NPDC088356]|uniref:zinc-dependent alcohol dehydrogenase n=1 Tax=Sphaerisporangium sp. NPDC088356 TaxID=3154871 RepID=UPI00342F0805
MTQSRAILIGERPQQVSVGTIDIPPLGPEDVLVASRVIGICRSDIELRDGHLDHVIDVEYPVVPGHEWSGVVVEAGRKALLAPGDRVVGECLITPHDWFGCNVNGAGSDVFTAPAKVLHKLPDEIDDTMGAMVEPFTIAFRAIREIGGCDPGDVVAVIGGGMIGQCAASICRANGAQVVTIEPNQRRRELALRLGADIAVDPADLTDAEAWFREHTGVAGPTLVVEASGAPTGLALAVGVAGFRGRVVMIGITATASIPAPLNLVQAKNLRILGVTGSPEVWPAALRFIARAGIDLRSLVSKQFPFDQAGDAFTATEDGDNLKIHLMPTLGD